ncbi:pre-peptidase C-terminal domain-containing protein, partial [Kaarinaea lacus]
MKLRALAITVASTLALSSNVWAMNEQEDNHPIQSSQTLVVTSSVMEVDAVLGEVGANRVADLDFFTFYGNAGDVVTLDIDGGYGGSQNVDTVIAVFDGDHKVLRMNDDSPVDEGSISRGDSRIDNFVLPATGYYTVGVSNFPRYFKDGGDVYYANYVANGDYQLVISGVSPSMMQISVDVKPGNEDDWAPINPKSRGKVPVALLSSSSFDAMTVEISTLTFGATGDEDSLSHCNKRGKDVNGDGMLDMLCHFNNQDAGFNNESLQRIVRRRTALGTVFERRGFLKVVPG